MTPIYTVAGAVLLVIILVVYGTFRAMRRFRALAADQTRQISTHMAEGLSLEQSINKVISDLNRSKSFGLTSETIGKVSERIAGLSSTMSMDNVVVILAQFTQTYLLQETRGRKPREGLRLDNYKVQYAAENLELQQKNGHYLLKPGNRSDSASKYSVGRHS